MIPLWVSSHLPFFYGWIILFCACCAGFVRQGPAVATLSIFMTPMVAGMTQELQDSLGKQVPFPPRLGRPEEYADLVESIYRNAMINGETIRLDGAIRMQPK